MFRTRQSVENFRRAALAHLNDVFRYAMALSQSQDEAEKLVEDTYRYAVQCFDEIPQDGALKRDLCAIARKLWLDHMNQAAGQRCRAGEPDDTAWHRRRIITTRGLECDQVRSAVQMLPRSYREVIVLREFDGFSYCEIADLMDCPAGTVWSSLERARKKLRLMLDARRIAAGPPLPEVMLR